MLMRYPLRLMFICLCACSPMVTLSALSAQEAGLDVAPTAAELKKRTLAELNALVIEYSGKWNKLYDQAERRGMFKQPEILWSELESLRVSSDPYESETAAKLLRYNQIYTVAQQEIDSRKPNTSKTDSTSSGNAGSANQQQWPEPPAPEELEGLTAEELQRVRQSFKDRWNAKLTEIRNRGWLSNPDRLWEEIDRLKNSEDPLKSKAADDLVAYRKVYAASTKEIERRGTQEYAQEQAVKAKAAKPDEHEDKWLIVGFVGGGILLTTLILAYIMKFRTRTQQADPGALAGEDERAEP